MKLKYLFQGSLRKGGGDQLLIGNARREFSGFVKDILEQSKAVFFKNQVRFPGVLLVVSGHNGGDKLEIGFLELGSNHLGDLLGRVVLYIIHAPLDSVGKGLNQLGVFIEEAGPGAVGCIGHIAGVHTQGGGHKALALLFQGGGSRFKFHRKVS